MKNTMNHNQFETPHLVDSFSDVKKLLPIDGIPAEFEKSNNKWNKAANKWFFYGIQKGDFRVKKNIDANKALNHLWVIINSFELRHEHKMAGVAYLMSLWFDDVFL